jgi:hypothetical protein
MCPSRTRTARRRVYCRFDNEILICLCLSAESREAVLVLAADCGIIVDFVYGTVQYEARHPIHKYCHY